MEGVKIIDISSFACKSSDDENAKHAVLKQWDHAFNKLGFAIIVGHGIPEQLIREMQQDAREFFEQAIDVKMKSSNKGYGKGGYFRMGIESVGRTMDSDDAKVKQLPPDLVESFKFHHAATNSDVIPATPQRLKQSVQKYWEQMNQLLSTIMKISALSLGLEENYFDSFFEDANCQLRLAYYPAQNKTKPQANQVRYAAHTDYTGFTILRQDDAIPGLEVLDVDKKSWVPVEIIENSFVINTGDLIQQWTNDHWVSNLHRVSNPTEEHSHFARLSMPFFTGPSDNSVITPLAVCCGKDNPAKYGPVVAGEHLQNKYELSNAEDGKQDKIIKNQIMQ